MDTGKARGRVRNIDFPSLPLSCLFLCCLVLAIAAVAAAAAAVAGVPTGVVQCSDVLRVRVRGGVGEMDPGVSGAAAAGTLTSLLGGCGCGTGCGGGGGESREDKTLLIVVCFVY